jgi:two-component system response regulator MtrA
MNENGAKTGNDGLGETGQNREPSLHDSDVSGSVPSNVARRSTMPEWGGVPGLMDVKGRRRILIVDDELAIADTLQMIFQLQRYDARVAYTAERAAELIAKWQPDLAVVDVILPGMNGIDLAIVIKANYPRCHVILFSGHTNTSMLLEEAVRKGHHFEVLAKPVMPELMLERASELLGGAADDPAYD